MKWLEISLGLAVCAGGIYLMFHPLDYGAVAGAAKNSTTESSSDSSINTAISGAVAAAGAEEAIGAALTLV